MIPAKEFEGELWIKAADFHRQKKEWQGLTDEEISELIRNTHNTGSFVRAIEVKLKQKNA
jgi:hypothetical protein